MWAAADVLPSSLSCWSRALIFARRVQALGFELRREEQRTCHYTQAPASMMQTQYTCAFFTAVKS